MPTYEEIALAYDAAKKHVEVCARAMERLIRRFTHNYLRCGQGVAKVMRVESVTGLDVDEAYVMTVDGWLHALLTLPLVAPFNDVEAIVTMHVAVKKFDEVNWEIQMGSTQAKASIDDELQMAPIFEAASVELLKQAQTKAWSAPQGQKR